MSTTDTHRWEKDIAQTSNNNNLFDEKKREEIL